MREGVEEVCVDMWGGFPKVIREVFPNAKIVSAAHTLDSHLAEICNYFNNRTTSGARSSGLPT